MSWRRGGQRWTWVRLDGLRKRIPLGTSSKSVADDIERMFRILVSKRRWRLLRAVITDKTVSVGTVFDVFGEGDAALARLEAELDDVDLSLLVDEWKRWVSKKANPTTVRNYVRQLRVLIPEGEGFPRSRFTRKTLSRALASLPGTGSTCRRYHACWSSFGRFLVETEVLEHNPLRGVIAPSENPPRDNFLELPDVLRLVDAQTEPFRTLAAFREGAGVEISAALQIRRGDVDLTKGIVQVRGTKNEWRSRPVYVEPWALERLQQLLKSRTALPDARLFDGASEWTARESHKAALVALALPTNYTMHDSRHSFAVRWMRAGIDPNLIASNLGHKDALLVMRVYGKHRPRAVDFAKLGHSFGHTAGLQLGQNHG